MAPKVVNFKVGDFYVVAHADGSLTVDGNDPDIAEARFTIDDTTATHSTGTTIKADPRVGSKVYWTRDAKQHSLLVLTSDGTPRNSLFQLQTVEGNSTIKSLGNDAYIKAKDSQMRAAAFAETDATTFSVEDANKYKAKATKSAIFTTPGVVLRPAGPPAIKAL